MNNENYKLDLRGGQVPHKEGNAAAVDFYCPKDTILNMPWQNLGRGHIDLEFGVELPSNVGLDIRSRSGFTNKGLLVDVLFIDKEGHRAGSMTNVRADIDIRLGLVDEDYRGNVGALYRVNSCNYYPTPESELVLDRDFDHMIFMVRQGVRICQGAFRKVENLNYTLGELNNEVDRGGGFGHGGAK